MNRSIFYVLIVLITVIVIEAIHHYYNYKLMKQLQKVDDAETNDDFCLGVKYAIEQIRYFTK